MAGDVGRWYRWVSLITLDQEIREEERRTPLPQPTQTIQPPAASQASVPDDPDSPDYEPPAEYQPDTVARGEPTEPRVTTAT